MIQIPALLGDPLSDDAVQVLSGLVQRRRDGKLDPPSVASLAEEIDSLAPVVRASAEELHERRLAVIDEEGNFAPIRWPRMASLVGRLRMNLADQLAAAGADVDQGLADAWAAADDEARAPADAEPSAEGPARQAWQAMMSAHAGQLAEAAEHCRHAAAGTITVAVVPMLARLAAWLDRVMLALQMPEARFLRALPPDSDDAEANVLYRDGWQAELVRNDDRAVRAYIAALRRDPAFDRARIRYAATLFKMGEIDAALAEMRRLVQSRPHVSAARLLLAEMLVALAQDEDSEAPDGWADEARAQLDAVQRDPSADLGWANVLLARALLLTGDPEGAAAAARRAIAIEPGLAEAHHALGTALTIAGDLLPAAWAEAAALLADNDFTPAAEGLFTLRQSPQVAAEVPHAHLFIDDSWQ